MAAINVTGLQREAKNYQKDFRLLPYALLIPVLKLLRISLLEVSYKDTIIVEKRKGGISKPYVSGTIDDSGEIFKLAESDLVTEACYSKLVDNIRQYRDKKILYDAKENKIDNKEKKHPLEKKLITNQLVTIGEDIIDSIFFSKRDVADKSPQGMFDGIYTKIDSAITALDVSVANGNLVNSGALDAPLNATDVLALQRTVAWLRNVHPKMKNKALVLRLTLGTLLNIQDALQNLYANKNIEFGDVLKYLQFHAQLPQLSIIAHYALGTGGRMTLTTPGNFDFGLNTMSEQEFIQIRAPYEDPNDIQFWAQWDAGTRVVDFDPMIFMVNELASVANPVSGDYIA